MKLGNWHIIDNKFEQNCHGVTIVPSVIQFVKTEAVFSFA
jgi:hypothetical protein